MAKTKNPIILYRRKRIGATDYKLRLNLLKSRKTRLVVRKSVNYITAQLIDYEPKGDKVLFTVNSKELDKHGWKFSKKSIPAAYLTGLLLGTKAKSKVKEAILDMGRNVSKKESKLYSVVKGVSDAGITIPISDEIMPADERINGSHVANYAEQIKDKKEKYNKIFSGYVKTKQLPEKMPAEFEKAKKSIMK